MANEVHCDTGEIMTNKGIRAQIGIPGSPRRNSNGRNKDEVYIDAIPIDLYRGGGKYGGNSYLRG